MTPEPTPLVTVLPCEADSGMSGDAIAQAEMFWSNLPTGNRTWTSLQTSEKALVCHVLSRHRLAALEAAAKVAEAMYVKDAFRFEFGNDIATAIRSLSNKTDDGGQESVITESEAIAIAPERTRCIDIFCHSCGWCVKNRRCAREVSAIMKGDCATGNAGYAKTLAASNKGGRDG